MQRQYIYIQSGFVKIRKENTMQNVTEADVTKYLQGNTEFLDDFVRNHVSLEKLELWFTERTQNLSKDNSSKNISLCQWRNYVYSSIHQILQDMFNPSTKLRIMWELCTFITHIIDAENFDLYIFDQNNSNVVYKHMGYNCSDKPYLVTQNFDSCAAVQYVVKKGRTSHHACGNISVVKNFPENDKGIQHSMYQTITRSDGELMAVVEFYKKTNEKCFNEQDNELAESYLFWGGVLLHYSQLLLRTNKQRKLNEFLLTVVKSIFQDMISMDVLIVKITHFAQRLVNADRASLFLIDSQSKEIYAKVFDIGEKSLESISYQHSQEIRFPIGVGLAGQVALSGQTLNIDNVELDPRFNCSIDQKTGYKTKNVLCMPIIVNGSIIGVMEMLNKRSGSFDKEDERSFEIFAIYCGLAIYNSELWEKIRRSEERHRVTLEVLSYHNTCSEDDVKLTLKKCEQAMVPNIDDFFFNPFQYDDFKKAQLSIQMFIDLFGHTKFDRETLVRFVLTVKKSYRNVPYHNWSHGFSVANCMFSLIKKSSKVFLANESLALFIGSLCHDLDHRGKNNKFMLETASPLAAIYTTSTMEHHHFNQTVTILQQSGHNILTKLSSCEYKRLLTLMKHCILATDLALFFPYKDKLKKWLDDKTFSWKVKDHRMHVLAIAMTASDLSASAKPWDIQFQTANVIFEEFYQQGEAEKAAGRTPLPMMDRDRSHKQAVFQIGFINSICIPCYDALYRLIPASEPLLLMCKENLHNWERLAENCLKLE